MTFDELVARVQNVPARPVWICRWDSDLLDELELQNVNIPDTESDRLVERTVCSWTCTDTGVGLSVLFLDDEAVALSFQRYRKSSPDYLWRDAQAKKQTFDYIVSLIAEQVVGEPRWLATEAAIDAVLDWVDEYEFKEHYRTCL